MARTLKPTAYHEAAGYLSKQVVPYLIKALDRVIIQIPLIIYHDF